MTKLNKEIKSQYLNNLHLDNADTRLQHIAPLPTRNARFIVLLMQFLVKFWVLPQLKLSFNWLIRNVCLFFCMAWRFAR